MIFLLLFLSCYIHSTYALDVIKQSCTSCHGQRSEIAPTFEEIFKLYKENFHDQKSMAKQYFKFIDDPSEKNVLLNEAYKTYGSMPKINLNNQEVKQIANYLTTGQYSNLYLQSDFQIPRDPLKRGKAIARGTKTELGKNLLKAIKTRKTLGAISFCNIKALPITTQKMKELNAIIKRATDRPRNPKNYGNTEELKYISLFKQQLSSGKELKPILIKTDKAYHFYSPIITNQMCMQCHGQLQSQISQAVLKKIHILYPQDKAINYKSNEVRGVFSISFEINKRK